MLAERVAVVEGDITKMKVDAIVNAANHRLLVGGGVDGAIHRAAGPRLLEACRHLNGCPTGQAKITPGFDLHARWVIHAVGPVWRGGDADEDRQLAGCYRWSMALAAEKRVETVAFPSIATGIFGFPLERAAKIAVGEVKLFLEQNEWPRKVFHVCFSRRDFEVYQSMVNQLYR